MDAADHRLRQPKRTADHFGLGDTERIERVEVRWPSGIVDRLESVEIDAVVKITEGANAR